MSRRRYPTRHLSRWLATPVIVVGVVAAFLIYEHLQNLQVPTVTNTTLTPLATQTASQRPASTSAVTPVPSVTGQTTFYKILSDKAGFTAEITEVYLARTDGWDLSHLDEYAGHLQDSALPGEGRNFVVAGHVELKDGRPGPFAHLNILTPGDTILLLEQNTAHSDVIRYTVTDDQAVSPDDFAVMQDHGFEELTLLTCGDWDAQDRAYHTRIVVHARPADKKVLSLS